MNVLVHKAIEPDDLSVAGKKRYEELITNLIQGYEGSIVQPKYDGVYAQFLYQSMRWHAYSRTGQLLKSVGPEILDAFDIHANPDRRYMGELWVPSEAHQTINGRARKGTPQWLELKLFDSVQLDHLNPLGPETYMERYDYLFESRNVSRVPNLPMVGKIFVVDDLYDQAKALKNRGSSAYDGLILRDAQGLFIPGPGKGGEVIKIKPRKEGDFRVVGTTKGQGNRKGGIGALVVDLGGGVHSEVGTGLSLTEINEKPKDVIGRIATIEYLSLTKDGKLREPSFKTYRFDKAEADTVTPETED